MGRGRGLPAGYQLLLQGVLAGRRLRIHHLVRGDPGYHQARRDQRRRQYHQRPARQALLGFIGQDVCRLGMHRVTANPAPISVNAISSEYRMLTPVTGGRYR